MAELCHMDQHKIKMEIEGLYSVAGGHSSLAQIIVSKVLRGDYIG